MAIRNISGSGKVLSLRPSGTPLSLWRKRRLPRVGGVCLAEGGKKAAHSTTSHPGKYHAKISCHVLPSSAIAFAPYWLRPMPWP